MLCLTLSTYLLWGLSVLSYLSHAKPVISSRDLLSSNVSLRPKIVCHPKCPQLQHMISPPRTKVCIVKNEGHGKDDATNILQAICKCNHGGHIVFSRGKTYTIGTALDLTDLENVDIDIQGIVKFTNDTTYWQANAFQLVYQNATTFFKLGGKDVNVFGTGTIDGNGQVWYDMFVKDPALQRPILFGITGLQGGYIGNFKMINPPSWFNFIVNSTDVIYDNLDMAAASVNNNMAKNTDGWDTYRSDSITIQNSNINNGDDCVSFKPNSTNMVVQNLHCNGSHGISVGSLGQYLGETDIVKNIYIFNVSLSDSSDGARIKVWPGVASSSAGNTGGGLGNVNNVTYDTIYNDNNDYDIELTQCYSASSQTACNAYPSKLTITNVLFKNFYGTTSKKHSPIVGTLVCSSATACQNITAVNINVDNPLGTNSYTCTNVNKSLLAVDCN